MFIYLSIPLSLSLSLYTYIYIYIYGRRAQNPPAASPEHGSLAFKGEAPQTYRQLSRKFDPRGLSFCKVMAKLRTKILDFGGFDSSRILSLRGGILTSV